LDHGFQSADGLDHGVVLLRRGQWFPRILPATGTVIYRMVVDGDQVVAVGPIVCVWMAQRQVADPAITTLTVSRSAPTVDTNIWPEHFDYHCPSLRFWVLLRGFLG
jgi:hypothetical protein